MILVIGSSISLFPKFLQLGLNENIKLILLGTEYDKKKKCVIMYNINFAVQLSQNRA